MLILAFDCSSPAGSVAVMEDAGVLASIKLDPAKRSAKTLAPAIEQALQAAGREMREVRLIATTVGPGSFTGLRVGVTIAKTLAYALKCDLVGLNTLDVLAAQVVQAGILGATNVIHAVLDAQRKELFVGRYQTGGNLDEPPRRINDGQVILSAVSWLESLQAGDVVTGSGLSRWMDKLPPSVIVAPAEFHELDAVTIGRLALREYEAGHRDDFWTFSPLYIRPSYADEKKQLT
ncbi:MAG: tRNA (adenosine(37)-N6)-threonylcarbamoyltransferase complex dimerization subunit type 1 TsaB [Pirellulaceae bacterium]